MHGEPQVTVLYDDACGFCKVAVAGLILWDRGGRLRLSPIQDPQGERLLSDLTPAERLRAAHAIGPDGRVRSGGAGASTVLATLPAGQPLAWLADLVPAMTDAAYRAVSASRPLLGRFIPTGVRHASDALIEKRRQECG